MKKILLICSFCLLALVSACAGKRENTPEFSEIFVDSHGIPKRISFNGIDKYIEFSEHAEADSPEFKSFIDFNHYSMNGIESKHDAKNALSVIDSLPFPHIGLFTLSSAELCFETDSFYLLFKSGDESKHISFNITLSKSDAKADRGNDKRNFGIIEIQGENGSELNYLARSKTSAANAHYYTNALSHRMELITNLSEDELLSMLRDCRFTTMSEYAKAVKGL